MHNWLTLENSREATHFETHKKMGKKRICTVFPICNQIVSDDKFFHCS